MRTDHERIGSALDLLTRGLFPFFEREMKAVHGEHWLDAAASSFRGDRTSSASQSNTMRWDAHTLLTVIWDQWNSVFRHTLGPTERSLVSELRNFRNRWAHQAPLDEDDSYRVLDSVQRLLAAVDGAGIPDIEREKLDLLRNRFGREVNAELANIRYRRRQWIDIGVFVTCGAVIVATTAIFIGPHNPLAATILSLFVIFVFGFFVVQRLTAQLPIYGIHECRRCRKVIYSEVCPYCEVQPLKSDPPGTRLPPG